MIRIESCDSLEEYLEYQIDQSMDNLQKKAKEWMDYHLSKYEKILLNKNNTTLSFKELKTKNTERCEKHFHLIKDWSPSDWSNAMAGEAGETCNVVKKMRRIAETPEEAELESTKYSSEKYRVLIGKMADEIADTIIYADLLATRFGLSLEGCIRKKFNEKSNSIGSNIKL